MTRHLFFAIILLATGVFVSPPAQADPMMRCEDRAANCIGRCSDRAAGAGDWGGHQNKCLPYCDRQRDRCVLNIMTRR